MDNFQIETAQNVNIFQNVAGIGERILAFIIDAVIIIIYILLVMAIFAGLRLGDDYIFVIGMTVGLPVFLYHLLWEMLWNGRSPGKAVLQLRVVNLDGSKPAFSNYLLRWLLRILDITITSGGLALVTILLNGKGQRIGDIAAGTTVISEKKTTNFSQTLWMEIPEGYLPKYPQVVIFKDAEMQTIKNIYQNARVNGNHNIILKLAAKTAGVMEIQFEENPIHFIDTVIKDYNYFTQQL